MTTITKIIKTTETVQSDVSVDDVVETLKDGKKFGVTFVKANGEIREMNARMGVKRYLKGGKSTIAHKDNLVSVFDVKTGDYRCFNKDTVKEIRAHGKVYKF